MPTPKVQIPRITAVSFSRLNDYRKCPAYAKYKHVDRLKEPGSAALDRGSAIHKLAEQFAKRSKRGKALPEELASFKEEFELLQTKKTMLEEQWAFDRSWNPVDWFAKDCHCRMVVDCAYHDLKRNLLVVIDHKTGKINPNHLEQVSLYALGGMQVNESVDGVEVQLWYLDHGIIHPESEKARIFQRKQVPALKKEWDKLFQPMLADTRFAPKPSNACRWCHFSSAKKGPCKF